MSRQRADRLAEWLTRNCKTATNTGVQVVQVEVIEATENVHTVHAIGTVESWTVLHGENTPELWLFGADPPGAVAMSNVLNSWWMHEIVEQWAP